MQKIHKPSDEISLAVEFNEITLLRIENCECEKSENHRELRKENHNQKIK